MRTLRLLLVCGLLVAGCATTGATPPPPPTPRPVPTPTALILVGHGDHNTPPFQLDNENYQITWSGMNLVNPTGDCFFGGFLRPVETRITTYQGFGRITIPADQMQTGGTATYHLTPGQYYVEILAGCDWTVKIAPLPAATP